ncbi:hypothetical protein AMJ85_07310 [candidate division BRC1 bacterium SM23_51]|nr:MAG: hypothetical protein AMJ85_07310 [candidate division BRC1 bacterium SM23_51]
MKKFVAMSLVAGLAVMALVAGSLIATAQVGPGRGRGSAPGQEGGRRGFQRPDQPRFDPAQMRDMMVQRLREPLDVTDEEWKAIEPLVRNVVEKQFATRGGGRPRRAPGERPGFAETGRRAGPFGMVSPEADALRQALDEENTPAQEIEAKLKVLRDARKKAEVELQIARDELRKVLTIRQEAELVLEGILN